MTNTPRNEVKWTIIRSRYIPCLWPLITYFDWPIKDWLKVNPGTDIHIYKNGHLTAVFNTEERKLPAMKVLEEINSSDLTELRNRGIKVGKEVVKKLEKLSKRAEKADVEDYITLFDEIKEIYPKIMRYNMLYWLWTSPLVEKEIREKLKDCDDKTAEEIFNILSQPTKESYSKKIEFEFNELVNSLKEDINSLKSEKEIKIFSEKYFWFPYEYVGPGIWDVETIKKRIKEAIDNPHEIKKANIKQKQKEIIKKYKIQGELLKLFEILQTLTIMQDDRKMFMSHSGYYINGVIIRRLAEKLKVKWEDALYIEQDLIKVYLKDKKDFYRRLKLRAEICITEHKDNYKKIYDGESARKFIKDNKIPLWEENEDAKEIKGQSANKGIYKGRARILKTSHIESFNRGDIIVTGMTTPDFAPLMKKAGAIVTDEGGITSHAAIISRELNIPCIIGTKNATKLLKDGDLIEVDAGKGIVRKL